MSDIGTYASNFMWENQAFIYSRILSTALKLCKEESL